MYSNKSKNLTLITKKGWFTNASISAEISALSCSSVASML